MINKDELKPVIEHYSEQDSNHLSILRDVLNSHEWAVERNGSLAHTLKSTLMSLCARLVVATYAKSHSFIFQCLHVNNTNI